MSQRASRHGSSAIARGARSCARAARRPACTQAAQPRAAAQRRGDHPRTGRRQAPRPGADRGGDLRRDEIRTAPVLGGRAGADADPARDRLLPRAPVRRQQLHRQRPRHAAASTWPTAATTCATCSTTTTATRCSPWPPTTAASRTSTAGSRRRSGEGGQLDARGDPVPGDARIRAAGARGAARLPRHLPAASSVCS